jgi:superfamily II DNA or RNA helicase
MIVPKNAKTAAPLTAIYCENVKNNAYLGKKGYTLLKSSLTKADETNIKDELTMIPFTGGATFGGDAEEKKFFVYRENTKKIYIPRFYGIERYGEPERSEISTGDTIECEFAGSLRERQIPIVNTYLEHVLNGNKGNGRGGGGVLEAECAAGKTVMGIYIISQLKKKTLILVHKEFLLTQWIERMQQFLPTARIGRIQGKVFDIENKDVVIGMIQTIYRNDYANETSLDSFGLTIIDEVHRIGSEEFSKALINNSTHYMLGISATVERKDKLTRILFMYIGPKIYSSEKESTDTVIVRGLNYTSPNKEYNEVEYDFRGNVKYSTMVSKICNYTPRSQFILGVLKDLIQADPAAQIIVLCHQIAVLNYLFQELEKMKIATVGKYIGGMKKDARKLSESKQIVLGSYAMASEGLDIPTLATLVLATPKTDVVQCVGRILRVKRSAPLIVDIVDSHSTFKNQWNKRKTYYRKCNYTIMQGTTIDNCEIVGRKKGACSQSKCEKEGVYKSVCESDKDSQEEESVNEGEEDEGKEDIVCEVDFDEDES